MNRTARRTTVVIPALLVLMAGVVVGLVGCRSEEPLADLLDEASQTRLEALSADANVLLSLQSEAPLEGALPLEEGGRRLGGTGNSVLLEVPRAALSQLADLEGLTSVVVWGGGEIVRRLDPFLRKELLARMDSPPKRDEPLSMIATFQEGADDYAQQLAALDVKPRSIVGNVATLDASPETAFKILALPSLVKLSQPQQRHPVGQKLKPLGE
jgi:hypothetical protein